MMLHTIFVLALTLTLVLTNSCDSLDLQGHKLLSLFSPLLLNESATYHVEVLSCIKGIGAPGTTCTHGSITSDPKNKRISFNFTESGGGVNTILETNSYFFGFTGAPDTFCLSTGTTYADQVGWYSKAVSQNQSTACNALYLGNVFDNGGCGIPIAVNYRTSKGIITQFAFSERFPVTATTCGWVESSVVSDMSTLKIGGNVDKYFELFPGCATPLDFCETLFPGTGPCALTPPVNPPP